VRVAGVDVIIAGRGGGSVEDLWAFNEEIVARAIAESPVPVISAVGHETDVTIADFVADLRAPTPSAAAEMVVAAHDEFCHRIERLSQRLHTAARQAVQQRRSAIHALVTRRGFAGWHARLAMHGRHAAELTHGLKRAILGRLARHDRSFRALRQRLDAQDVQRRLAASRGRLTTMDERLRGGVRRSHQRADARLRVLAGRLENLSPLAVLSRGYAVCWNADRTRIIRSAAAVAAGDDVRVTLHEGEITCTVRPPNGGE
jgi:exodeoxyribonuclease VII large subunit